MYRDTAGQERFHTITKAYYRGAHVSVALVFCAFVCVYVCFVCTYVCTCVCMCICENTCLFVCVCVCVYIFTQCA